MAVQTKFTVSTGGRMPKTGGIKMGRLLICRFACMVTLLAAASTIAASQAWAAGEDTQTGGERCAAALQDAPQPPANLTRVLLRVLQPSIEPVPATDGLIHLAYVAQVTNTAARPADILEVVALDPLADFAPTGRNIEVDTEGNDVTGKVTNFPVPAAERDPSAGQARFFTQLAGRAGGIMMFDVTYTDPGQIPRLLAHAITVAIPVGEPGVRRLTTPVPVGCVPLAVVHPPLVGHGWAAIGGCCTTAEYHRDGIYGIDGDLRTPEHFAIDFIQIGPNNSALKGNGPPEAPSSYWGYGAPVLAVAGGVVVEVVDGRPDQQHPPTIEGGPFTPANAPGNHVIQDIGGGRYVWYEHLKPGTIPAGVRQGAALRPGELIGRVGSSGNSTAPHMHFQVTDRPSPVATGLPFVFDTQLLEGRVSEGVDFDLPVTIDRTGAGVKRNLMPARNDIFGYNLSR
jgi:hypothetical protein